MFYWSFTSIVRFFWPTTIVNPDYAYGCTGATSKKLDRNFRKLTYGGLLCIGVMRYNIQIQQQAQSSTTHMPFCRTALLLSVEVSAAAVCRSKHNAISSAAVAAVRHKHRQQYIARSSHRYATPVTAAPPSSWLSLSFSFQLSLSYRIVLRDRRGRQVR